MNVRPIDEDFINLLPTRAKRDLKTLHVVSANDQFYCLDLSVKAPTLKELNAVILATLERADWNEPLPAAPKEDWLQLPSKMKFLRRYVLPLILRPPYRLGVILLAGAFQENW